MMSDASWELPLKAGRISESDLRRGSYSNNSGLLMRERKDIRQENILTETNSHQAIWGLKRFLVAKVYLSVAITHLVMTYKTLIIHPRGGIICSFDTTLLLFNHK